MTTQSKPVQTCTAVCTLLATLALSACSGDESTGVSTGGAKSTSGGVFGSGGTGNQGFGGSTVTSGGSLGTTGGSFATGGTQPTSSGGSAGMNGLAGSAAGGASPGGAPSSSGGTGGVNAQGGSPVGGASGGTSSAGAKSTGGATNGGNTATGGSAGGGGKSTTGGSASGGATGGIGGGGAATGGAATGGAATGGAGTGGSATTCKADFGMYGYAKASGVTGGKGGGTTRVSTLSALQSAASGSGAAIIVVTGKISGSAKVDVASNKTIVGEGSAGELAGIELNLSDSSNIIIRNLKVHHVLASNNDGDAIHLQDTTRVWIDHCELWADSPAVNADKDKFDGLIDLTHATQNVTVSWTYLHDHWKGLLNGSSDSDASDRRLTMHHNYVRNINSRLPSFRGGSAHVYNNYYEAVQTSGVNTRVNACIRVERNHFFNVVKPIATLDSDVLGRADVIDNLLEGSTPATGSEYPAACTWSSAYQYTADPVSCVKALVTGNAGVGKIDPLQGLP